MFVKEETRQLARIVRIDALRPIPKADRIEIAVVGGWECVVQKGIFKVKDPAVYFEIDAAIPIDHPLWGDFDKKYLRVRTEKGTLKQYATIKTVRLRGALSQGLLMEVKNLEGTPAAGSKIGKNVTNMLDVLKYVSPEEAKLYMLEEDDSDLGLIGRFRRWLTKGIVQHGNLPFPYGHVKSDEERVQNLKGFYEQMVEQGSHAEITIKLNGESATFYTDLETMKIGAASRNGALRVEDVPYTKDQSRRVFISDWTRFIWRRLRRAKATRPVWKHAYVAQSMPLVAYFCRREIAARILDFNESNPFDFAQGKVLSIQGEMIGPNFNRNREGVDESLFFMYRAYLNGNLLCTPEQSRQIAAEIGLSYIPVVNENYKLPTDMSELLKLADGPGYFDRNRKREGIVVKDNATGKSFKVLSNKWLELEAKEEEEYTEAEDTAAAVMSA